MKDNCIVMFIQPPVPESVDPALRAAFGDEKACQIYTDMAHEVLSAAKKLANVHVTPVYNKTAKHPDLRWLDQEDPGFLIMRNGTPAEEMMKAVRWTMDAGARRIVILSPLSPGVPQDWVEKAFETLEEKHIVIGPAQDGACYLIGMNGLYDEVFSRYPWPGKRMADEIAEKAKHLRLQTYNLPEFYAVHDEKTYQQWQSVAHKKEQKPAAEEAPAAAAAVPAVKNLKHQK